MFRGVRLAAATAACAVLGAACSPAPDTGLLEAPELTTLLLTAAETGLPGAVAGPPVEAGEGTMSLSTVMRDVHAEALRAGLRTRLLPHASSSRLFTVDAARI